MLVRTSAWMVLSLILVAAFAALASAAPVQFTWAGKDATVVASALYPNGVQQYPVEPGKGSLTLPNATLVLAANPTRSAQVAAAELNHYVEKITGTKLPVLTDACNPVEGAKILVGESALTHSLGLKNSDFADQEYLIRSYGNILVLMGRDEEEYGPIDYEGDGLWPGFARYYDWSLHPNVATRVGSVYAVDTFLQRCAGVRWYMPGDLGEVCPQQKSLTVTDLDLRLKPWTSYRAIWPPLFQPLFNFLGSGRPQASMSFRDTDLWLLRMKIIGSEAFACNHSLLVHWMQQRFPDKPELLAKGYDHPTQLCLTDPELLRIVAQDADDYFNGKTNYERGAGDYFPVMPMDDSNYCQCPDCQALLAQPSGDLLTGFFKGRASVYTWTFVNKVARELQKTHPGKWVSCCSYASYANVPNGVPIEDNVAVMCCRVLIEGIANPIRKAQARARLAEWSQAAKRWYVWEYFDHLQDNAMECNFPGVFLHEIADDIHFLKANGCRGMSNELDCSGACVANFAEDHLNVYTQLQMLNDASIDVDALRDEYCKLFYGPAAAPMKQFYLLLEERFTNPAYRKLGPNDIDANWDTMCPPSVLSQFGALIDQASSLAVDEPYATRVRLIKEAVYGMMVKNCMKHFVMIHSGKRNLTALATTDPANLPDTPANHVTSFSSVDGDPTFVQSEAWVAHDAQNLYVKVKCYEDQPETIMANVTTYKQPDLLGDDSVELFLDPGRTRRTYYEVMGNTLTAIDDMRYPGDGSVDTTWKSGVTSQVVKDAKAWTITFTVPLKNFTGGQPIKPGEVWGFNICRNRRHADVSRPDMYTAWCPTGTDFHAPNAFGVLTFE